MAVEQSGWLHLAMVDPCAKTTEIVGEDSLVFDLNIAVAWVDIIELRGVLLSCRDEAVKKLVDVERQCLERQKQSHLVPRSKLTRSKRLELIGNRQEVACSDHDKMTKVEIVAHATELIVYALHFGESVS